MSHILSDVLFSLLDQRANTATSGRYRKSNLREALGRGCNPRLMNSRLTYLCVYSCMLDFQGSLFLAFHFLFMHFLYSILFPVAACSLLNILSVSLETDPPDMRHIVRRD